MDFGELVHRFGPQAQERQIWVAGAFPDIAQGGWDVDLTSGNLRFRASGRTCPIEVIGSEANGSWMWGWANASIGPALVKRVTSIREWGKQRGIEALTKSGFALPPWEPGKLLSGMSCMAIAAGLLNAPAIYCCENRASGVRLYVVLLDEGLREPPPESPLDRVALRFGSIYLASFKNPHEGGIPFSDWVLALDGYCRTYGVDGEMDGDDVILSFRGRTARASRRVEGSRSVVTISSTMGA
jgi:hypothetical protein